jgi:hypothetical protein
MFKVYQTLIIHQFIPGYVASHHIVFEYLLFLFMYYLYLLPVMLKYAIYTYLEYMQDCNKHDL